MLHPAWIAREAPLAQCPLAACRRSKQCRHSTDNDPCRRLHETMNAARNELAVKLERMKRDMLAKQPPGVSHYAPEGSPEFERRMKRLYDWLRIADKEGNERLKAEREKAEAEERRKARRTRRRP